MRVTECLPCEIRPGTIFIQDADTFTVTHVVFRLGRGLEIFTLRADGYVGPTFYPHPSETVSVLYTPSLTDSDAWFMSVTTADFPWADVRI
jgi:hypothetical protein